MGATTFVRRAGLFGLLTLLTLALTLGIVAIMAAAPAARANDLNSQAAYVGGPILTDTIWLAANSPYILSETVTVFPGVTLTIEPGVLVQAMPLGALSIDSGAHLHAVGTPGLPITFTTLSSPAVVDWSGLLLFESSAMLSHVNIRYSQWNVTVEGAVGGGVQIEDSSIQDGGLGMLVQPGSLHRLDMRNVTFTNNLTNHVYVDTQYGGHFLLGEATLSQQPGLDGYEIPSYVRLTSGTSLTIEPGVRVLASGPGYNLLSVGEGAHLEAAGTANKPITFTSVAATGPGDWAGIDIVSGTLHLDHAHFRNSALNLIVFGASSDPVLVENSSFQEGIYGMIVQPQALPRLQMRNVTFTNNLTNHVYIDTRYSGDSLLADATLSQQPGLDGYEIPSYLQLKAGTSLTIEPGVSVLASGPGYAVFWVEEGAHLEAVGTAAEPITFTSATGDWPNAWASIGVYSGSLHMDHAYFSHSALNLDVWGAVSDSVQVRNSRFENSVWGLVVQPQALHRLQLNNLTFTNIITNRIAIDPYGVTTTLAGSARLAPQAGLDGYQIGGPGYPADGPLIVPAGYTLTLDAGTKLWSTTGTGIQVAGGLATQGTLTSPVVLDTLVGGPGRWDGVQNLGGNIDLENTQILNSGGDGLGVFGGRVTAVCSTFSGHQGNGLFVSNMGSPLVTLFNGNVFGNLQAGLNNSSTIQVDARYNWWGDPSGPSGIGPGSGDAVFGSVQFDPWLSKTSDCGPLTTDWILYVPGVWKP